MTFDFREGFRPASERMEKLEEQRVRWAARALPFRVAFLDDIALAIMPFDLIVIGAQTGAGKTTLAAILAHAATRNGVRVAYFALEAHKGEIEQRMLFRIMGQKAWERQLDGRQAFSYANWLRGQCDRIANAVLADARAELEPTIAGLRTYYRDGRFTVDDLIRNIGAVRGEVDLIILDHLHFIDTDDANEHRAMGGITKAISDTVLDTETPVVAIAHLRKRDLRQQRLVPDIAEFHGSSEITKIATKCIVLAPDRESETRAHVANTFMRVAKDRLAGDSGFVAKVGFDLRTNSYENTYVLGRLSADGSEFELLEDRPWWAEHASSRGVR